MASVRPVGDFPDASEMLAEALKQMDGLLAGMLPICYSGACLDIHRVGVLACTLLYYVVSLCEFNLIQYLNYTKFSLIQNLMNFQSVAFLNFVLKFC